MSEKGSSGSMNFSNTSKGVAPTTPFNLREIDVREASVKGEAMADLKKRQDEWKLNEKMVKDLEGMKNRSADEDEKLDNAKRYLLVNTKPAMGGRKSRKHKKGSKKTRKHKKGSRRR